jgi:hypothetical protein
MTAKIFALRTILGGGVLIVATGLWTAGVASAATPHHIANPTSGVSAHTSTLRTKPMGDAVDLSHGPGETLLTGTDLTSADVAALAAVPGATVVRSETDSTGSAFEVHLRRSDGTYVTAKLNSSFVVTSIENGFGAGPCTTPPTGSPAMGTPSLEALRDDRPGLGPLGVRSALVA